MPAMAMAQIETVFKDIETKGNTLIDFFTGDIFALLIVGPAVTYIGYRWIVTHNMDLNTAIKIFLGALVFAKGPAIAAWLISSI